MHAAPHTCVLCGVRRANVKCMLGTHIPEDVFPSREVLVTDSATAAGRRFLPQKMAEERLKERLAEEKEETLLKKQRAAAKKRKRDHVRTVPITFLYITLTLLTIGLQWLQAAMKADRLAAAERADKRSKGAGARAASHQATSSSSGGRVHSSGRTVSRQAVLDSDSN